MKTYSIYILSRLGGSLRVTVTADDMQRARELAIERGAAAFRRDFSFTVREVER